MKDYIYYIMIYICAIGFVGGAIYTITKYIKTREVYWKLLTIAMCLFIVGYLFCEIFINIAWYSGILFVGTYIMLFLAIKKAVNTTNKSIKLSFYRITILISDFLFIILISIQVFLFINPNIANEVFEIKISARMIPNFLYPILDFSLLAYFILTERILNIKNKKAIYTYVYIGFFLMAMTDILSLLERMYRIEMLQSIDMVNNIATLIIVFAFISIKKEELGIVYTSSKAAKYKRINVIELNTIAAVVVAIYSLVYVCSIISRQEYSQYYKYLNIFGIIILGSIAIRQLLIEYRNNRQFAWLESSVTKDYLTKAYSREYGFNVLREFLVHRRLDNIDLSIMMIDIDLFKGINDTYGHVFGDYALRKIVEIIKGSLFNQGIISRYGGEEFLVILPNCSSEKSFEQAEQIRKNVKRNKFSYMDVKDLTITISIGGSTANDKTIDELDIIERADIALYEAKKTRNTTVWKCDEELITKEG